MLKLVLRRFRDILIMIIGMAIVTPAMLNKIPGGYCGYALPDTATIEQRKTCENNQPTSISISLSTLQQWGKLDFGQSRISGRPITLEIAEQLPGTLKLSFFGLFIGLVFGITGGILAVQGSKQLYGRLINWTGIFLISLPTFIIAFVLLQIFAIKLQFVRILGEGNTWKDMLLPGLSLALPIGAIFMRITRNTMMDVMKRNFIRTAKAKGLNVWRIVIRHAMPNTLAALIPLIGLIFASLLDGALLIEIIFARQGLGKYTLSALETHDYVALQGIVLFVTVATTMINLTSDIVQALMLPQSKDELLA